MDLRARGIMLKRARASSSKSYDKTCYVSRKTEERGKALAQRKPIRDRGIDLDPDPIRDLDFKDTIGSWG